VYGAGQRQTPRAASTAGPGALHAEIRGGSAHGHGAATDEGGDLPHGPGRVSPGVIAEQLAQHASALIASGFRLHRHYLRAAQLLRNRLAAALEQGPSTP
jgi:hypothetical protein